jgi:hypothetical protein
MAAVSCLLVVIWTASFGDECVAVPAMLSRVAVRRIGAATRVFRLDIGAGTEARGLVR